MYKTLIYYIKGFGLKNTMRIIVYPQILSILKKNKSFAETRRPYVRDYVYKEIEDVIMYHRDNYIKSMNIIEDDCPIWVCWWQGFDKMPELANLCFQYLHKNKEKHKVIFIDKNNFQNYIHIPEIILKKIEKSEMSVTHFTDILRFALLKEHGGIWFDALIMMIKPLNIQEQVFYTNKNIPKNNDYISAYRWTGGVLACGKENELVKFVYDSYISYWSKNKYAIDYMIMDYILDIGYNEIPIIKKMIDNVNINNPNFYALKTIFNKSVNTNFIGDIYKDTELLALNRRLHCEEKDSQGRLTYYGYFKNNL